MPSLSPSRAASPGPIARGTVARVGTATALTAICGYGVIYLAARDLTGFSSWLKGKRVLVESRDANDDYTGTTAGLDAQGFLRVTADDGSERIVVSGGLREI